VQPFSEHNFLRWYGHGLREAEQRLLKELGDRVHGASPSSAEASDDSLAAEIEKRLVRVLNRDEQVPAVETAEGVPLFLVRGFSSDWLEALADHLAIRQGRGDYEGLGDCGLALGVPADFTPDGYRRNLLRMIAPASGADGSERQVVDRWLQQGAPVKVIYTAFAMQTYADRLAKFARVVHELFDRDPGTDAGRRVIVLFGCIDDAEEAGIQDAGDALHWLRRPGTIGPAHIEMWLQRFPERSRHRWDAGRVRTILEHQFTDGAQRRHGQLMNPLLHALKRARISGGHL